MDTNTIKKIIHRIDGKGYKAYKELESQFQYPGFQMFIDHVQGDPFAAPSAIRVRVGLTQTAIPAHLLDTPERTLAAEDFLTRLFARHAGRICKGVRGTGYSGQITIQQTGQEILKRSSVVLDAEYVEFRFYASLPARGRSILGSVAEAMLLKEIPDIVHLTTAFDRSVLNQLILHVHVFEDYHAIRNSLDEMNLVAFVPNGAILPRKSGIDERPLTDSDGHVVPFRSPETLEVKIKTPHSGTVSGMGIPAGITIIAGGGFHGKSTLLNALVHGVYGHIPMDGRELLATVPDAVKIRAEDGRSITQVNIAPFIHDLPYGKNTSSFTTENASGSTSQAANIMEALECGTGLLLIDEDTSATNFMIRDGMMRSVVRKEPITPLIDVIQSLHMEHGVSTVIVTGGAGDYFTVADTVILMEDYLPYDVTQQAVLTRKTDGVPFQLHAATNGRRLSLPSPLKGRREKFAARGKASIQIGSNPVDISALEQIVEPAQSESIAFLMKQYHDATSESRRPVVELVQHIHSRFVSGGFTHIRRGNLAVPRMHEFAFTINRVRGLNQTDAGTGSDTTEQQD